jgi:hypothetical protein
MEDRKIRRLRYFEYLTGLLRETYLSLKQMKPIPDNRKSFIEGVMAAGRFIGVTNYELEKLIEKVNYDVFGMSIAERKKVFKEIPPAKHPDYDIPTYVRKGKKLSI